LTAPPSAPPSTLRAAQIARAPFEAERHAIDISGDGTNNAGRDVRFDRDQAAAKGIVVNGLVILTDIQFSPNPAHTTPPGGIQQYYRDNVIGGPGSFVMVAEDYNSFGRAMVAKLIAEIATAPVQRRSVSAEASPRANHIDDPPAAGMCLDAYQDERIILMKRWRRLWRNSLDSNPPANLAGIGV
jgi:hypothetical protein